MPVLPILALAVLLIFCTRSAVADIMQDCEQGRDYDLTISGCSEVIRTNPSATRAYGNRAAAYLLKRNFDQAVADYAKTIELDPKNALGYAGRANAYAMNEDHDHAIMDYTKAIELSPAEHLYVSRGTSYNLKGEFDRAIAD